MINVNDLIGSEYKLHGRTKADGFDCYGLVMEVQKRIGVNLPDLDYQSDSPELFISFLNKFKTERKIKKIGNYIEGAILLFENGKGLRNHIGVYVGDGCFVHCNKAGVHIDRVTSVSKKSAEIYLWQN